MKEGSWHVYKTTIPIFCAKEDKLNEKAHIFQNIYTIDTKSTPQKLESRMIEFKFQDTQRKQLQVKLTILIQLTQ